MWLEAPIPTQTNMQTAASDVFMCCNDTRTTANNGKRCSTHNNNFHTERRVSLGWTTHSPEVITTVSRAATITRTTADYLTYRHTCRKDGTLWMDKTRQHMRICTRQDSRSNDNLTANMS